MKARLKFSKVGSMRFIGHLDVMRYFQKAMRRADVAICYSSGFSPHQIMSFAAPLGVGITSMGEYLDIQVEESEDLSSMKERLNRTMAEGFHVENCRRLPESAGNAMSVVAAAKYTVSFRPGYEPDVTGKAGQWMKDFAEFYRQDTVVITKKTKKGEKELDLKPLIYELSVKDGTVQMVISTGSAENIKPELVMDTFSKHQGTELSPFSFLIQREEVYAWSENGKLIPLDALGEKDG